MRELNVFENVTLDGYFTGRGQRPELGAHAPHRERRRKNGNVLLSYEAKP